MASLSSSSCLATTRGAVENDDDHWLAVGGGGGCGAVHRVVGKFHSLWKLLLLPAKTTVAELS
jgi:hypothetical protein